jgi:hypothetical protein
MFAPLKFRKSGLQTLRLRTGDDKIVATIRTAKRAGFSATIVGSSLHATPAGARIKE